MDRIYKSKGLNMKIIGLISVMAVLYFCACQNKSDNAAGRIRWDSDGMLVIDGQRTFIIGAYHLPKEPDPYRSLQENGYNYIHVPAQKEALDQAEANRLMAWISTGEIRADKAEEDQKRIVSLVAEFKKHPALLCWEIADEPAFTWNSAAQRISAGQMITTYQIIKKEDVEHLVYTNHGPVNLVSTLQKYNPGTDIIACDIYPVIPHGITPTYALFDDGLQGDLLNTYISQVGEYTEKMHRVVDNKQPVFMVLQGFAWEMLKNEEERNQLMIEYPTYEQSRFMAYNAIVHGASGINYWGMHYTPQPSKFMDELNDVTRELSDMQPVLSTAAVKMDIGKNYHEMGHSVDAGIEIMVKKVVGILYMIAVNSDKNPVRITFSDLPDVKQAEVLKENRILPVQAGALTDEFRPFDVHVYKFK
jgi:hypothetical protein